MTNTVSYPNNIWKNGDSLRVRFGTDVATDSVVGAPWSQGTEQVLECTFDYAHMPTFTADDAHGQFFNNGYPSAGIPTSAVITKVTLNMDTLFSTSGSPTVSVGLVDINGAEIDNNGILATATVAHLNQNNVTSEIGALVNYGPGASTTGSGTGQGSIKSISSTSATMGYPWVAVATATLTAGHGVLRIFYFVPSADAGGADSA